MNMDERIVRGYEFLVAITVRSIVEVPDLRTWVHAGAEGLDREVAWAHVCEMPDPVEWLGAGDLLMTTGMGIPADPLKQRRFVERLADAGLSGIAVGDRMNAPEISDEMRAAADERAPIAAKSTPACSRRCASTRPRGTRRWERRAPNCSGACRARSAAACMLSTTCAASS
jgi:hypothetical protein